MAVVLPPAIIGVPRQFDVEERPLPATSVGRARPIEALVQACFALELHEPRSRFRFAARRCRDLADDATVRPMVMWVGKRGRVGQIGPELLQAGIVRRLLKLGTKLVDGQSRPSFGGLGQHLAQLRVGQDKRVQGFHKQ